MCNISLDKLRPNPLTGTLYAVDSNFQSLLDSVSLFGVLEPLIVFSFADEPDTFQVVSGNRRLKAAQTLNIKELPCTIVEPVELNEARVSAHQEQRVKQPSDIIRELRILETEFGLRQGVRSNCERIKTARAYRDRLVKTHKKSNIDRLRQFDKKVRELVGDDEAQYRSYMDDLDRSGNVSGSLNQVKSRLENQRNHEVAGDLSLVEGEQFTIHKASCENMTQLEDESVATIVTSPPYFQMRVYDNGVEKSDQLGQEASVGEFCSNLARVFDDAKRVLKKKGSLFVNIADNIQHGHKLGVPYRFAIEMMDRGWILNDTIVWSKVNPTFQLQKRTVTSHEYVFHFVKTVEFDYDRTWIGQHDFSPHELTLGSPNGVMALRSHLKFDGNVLTTAVPNNHQLRVACKEQGMMLSHSATFPKELPLVAIMSTSKPGDLVVDMFNGTGTTGEVAASTNRRYVGYELSPVYLKFSDIRMNSIASPVQQAA